MTETCLTQHALEENYICVFVWGFSSQTIIFHSYGDVAVTGEMLQILTYARH